MRPTPRFARTAALAALLLVLAGCDMPERDMHSREERLKSSVPLAPQAQLVIEAHAADVRLLTSPDDSVHVITLKRVHGFSQRDVNAVWSQLRVTIERSGPALVLRVYQPARGNEHVTVNFGPYSYRRAIEMQLTVSVPAGHDVLVHTDSGDLGAYTLHSNLAADTRSGNVRLVDQRGAATLETSSGDVVVDGARGALSLRTRSGDVQADSLLAGADIHTTSGDVTLVRSYGPFGVETGSGEVHLKNSRGNAILRTGSGDIEYYAASDSLLTESTSGDQGLVLLSAPRRIASQASSGDVRLSLPAGTGGQLDVETSSGDISVKSPLKVDSMSRKHLAGSLGGAGSTWVHTSSGDITVTTAHDAAAAASGGDEQ